MKSLAVLVPAARLPPGVLLAIGLANANAARSGFGSRPTRGGWGFPLLLVALALVVAGGAGLYVLR